MKIDDDKRVKLFNRFTELESKFEHLNRNINLCKDIVRNPLDLNEKDLQLFLKQADELKDSINVTCASAISEIDAISSKLKEELS